MHILSENILMFILSHSRKRIGSGGALSGDSCDDAVCPKDAQQVVGLWVLGNPCQGVDFLWVVGFSCIVLVPWPASVCVLQSASFAKPLGNWQLALVEGN